MFGKLFRKGPTTKGDIFFTVMALLASAWKVYDTVKNYQHDQAALNYQELK